MTSHAFGMPMNRRRVLAGAAALGLAGWAGSRPAFAADYPAHPITLIVPFAPGGATDLAARVLASQLGPLLNGASVIVENKGGGGGNIGIGMVARANPDGYTLLVSSSIYVCNPSLYPDVPYDPFKSFVPLVDLGASPNVIIVRKDSEFKTIGQLIAAAKADPKRVSFSTAGVGTTPELGGELLKLHAGIDMLHVPYPGAGPAVQAVLANTTTIGIANLAVIMGQIKGGSLRALAQTGVTRWPDLPDVPTLTEAGYPGCESETFQALFAPANTPKEICDLLVKDTIAAITKPDVKKKLYDAGFGVIAGGPAVLMARIDREVPMWKDVVAKANIHM